VQDTLARAFYALSMDMPEVPPAPARGCSGSRNNAGESNFPCAATATSTPRARDDLDDVIGFDDRPDPAVVAPPRLSAVPRAAGVSQRSAVIPEGTCWATRWTTPRR